MIGTGKNQLSCILTMAVFTMFTSHTLGRPGQTSPTPAKRVITNEDLQKYQEKSGSVPSIVNAGAEAVDKRDETIPASKSEAKVPTGATQTLQAKDPQNRLKEAEDALQKAKLIEESQTKALSKFQKRLMEAQNDFDRQTATWQVEDTEKNLARAAANRKKAEEQRAMLQEEVKKKKESVDK